MKLTRKQKILIDKLKDQTPHKIATDLNLNIGQVQNYLGVHRRLTPANSTGRTFTLALRLFVKENIGQIVLIVFLTILSYSSSLPNSMVSDDKPLMASPNLQNPLPIVKDEPVNAIINSLTYTLNFLLNGTSPFGYHLVNVFLHLAVTLTVFFFISLLLNSKIGFLTSLLFGILPLHSEAVSWISGRHYLLYTLFSLFALIFYILIDQLKTSRLYYYLSLVFFVLAVYSFPEMAIIFPLLLLPIDLYRGKLSNKFKLYLPFFVLAGLFSLLSLGRVQQRVQEISSSPQLLGEAPINYFLSVIISLNTYLKLFFLPFDLSFYHESLSFSILTIVIMILLVIGLLATPIIFFRKNRLIMLGVVIYFVALLPTLTPFKVSWVAAERYAYLAALGPSLILAYLIDVFLQKPKFTLPAKFVLVILVVAYSLLTFKRGFDWKDEDSLWLATVKTSPTSSKAWNNMGDYYGRHRDAQKSFEAFVRATQLNPTYSDAWHNAGNVLLQSGRYQESLPYFAKSLEYNPSLFQAYNKMAIAYQKLGREEESLKNIDLSLKINPQAAETYTVLGSLLYEKRNWSEARRALEEASRLEPENLNSKNNLIFLEKQYQLWQASQSADLKP